MTIGQIAHDLTGLCKHELFILPVVQREIHRELYVLGPREENGALADREVGSSYQPVLSRPRIDGFEQNFVRLQDILVRETLDRGETVEGRINAGGERRVLKPPDDVEVFFVGEIAQIPARLEIAERIECHGLVSRR